MKAQKTTLKTKAKLNYLTPEEFKMFAFDVNMQIALGLQSCKTKAEVCKLLDDVRLHERKSLDAEIQQLKKEHSNIYEQDLRIFTILRQKIEELEKQIETAKQNLINLLKSYGMEEKRAKRVMERVFGEKTET